MHFHWSTACSNNSRIDFFALDWLIDGSIISKIKWLNVLIVGLFIDWLIDLPRVQINDGWDCTDDPFIGAPAVEVGRLKKGGEVCVNPMGGRRGRGRGRGRGRNLQSTWRVPGCLRGPEDRRRWSSRLAWTCLRKWRRWQWLTNYLEKKSDLLLDYFNWLL